MPWRQAMWMTGLVLLAAFALRLGHLDAQDIWWDEARNIDVAGRQLAAIATSPELDIHPPLYFYVLHGWMGLVGSSAFAVRLLSTLFGLLTMVVLYQLGRAVEGRLAGVLAALVAGLVPFAVGEAQETRMYTMTLTWMSLSGLCLFRAVAAAPQGRSGGWAAWAGLAVFSAFSVLTHYSSLFVLAAFAAYAGFRWLAVGPGRRTDLLLRSVASGAVAVLLCVPQAAVAWRQIPGYGNPNLVVPTWWEYLGRCWQAFNLGLNVGTEGAAVWLWGIALLCVAGLALAVRYGGPAHAGGVWERGHCTWGWVLLLLWVVLPLALYYWVLRERATFDPRYISFVAPAYWLLLGIAMAAFWKRTRCLGLLATAFLVAVLAPAVHSDLTDPAYFREDVTGVVNWLREAAAPDDLILADQRYPFGLYYPRWNNDFDGFPPPEPSHLAPAQYLFVDINDLDRRLAELAAGRSRIFWVQWYKTDTDPRGALDFLLRKFGSLGGEQEFRGYQVHWYDIAPDTQFELVSDFQEMRLAFSDHVELLGWAQGGRGGGVTSSIEETRTGTVPKGQPAWAVARWRQLPGAAVPLKVSLRLAGEDGTLIGQNDRRLLNDRHLQIPHWGPEDRPLNTYLVDVPAEAPAGTYSWQMAVYDPATLEPVSWVDQAGQLHGEPATLGRIRVVDS